MSGKVRNAAVQIQDVEFDPPRRTLAAGERKTLLDERSCSIFLLLADHLGDCVSKEELLRAAWPTQLVHENSLAKAISKLRRALDGSSLEIVAAYGIGYILRAVEIEEPVAPAVTETAPANFPEAEPTSPTPPPPASRPLLRFAPVLAFLLIVSAAAVAVALNLDPGAIPVRRAPPLTHDPPDALATILWVDDHPSNNELDVEELRRHRLAVHLAQSTDDALKLARMNRYRLVISDLGRGEDRLAGLHMIDALRQRGLKVPVMIYTIRPSTPAGQAEQRRLIAKAGAADLALTPEEVRAKALKWTDAA